MFKPASIRQALRLQRAVRRAAAATEALHEELRCARENADALRELGIDLGPAGGFPAAPIGWDALELGTTLVSTWAGAAEAQFTTAAEASARLPSRANSAFGSSGRDGPAPHWCELLRRHWPAGAAELRGVIDLWQHHTGAWLERAPAGAGGSPQKSGTYAWYLYAADGEQLGVYHDTGATPKLRAPKKWAGVLLTNRPRFHEGHHAA